MSIAIASASIRTIALYVYGLNPLPVLTNAELAVFRSVKSTVRSSV